MQRLLGQGMAFVEIDGELVEYELAAGQQLVVDTGNVAGFETSVSIDIQQVPGLKNKVLGGEGFFNTLLTGLARFGFKPCPFQALQAPSEASSRPEINFQAHSTFRGHAVPFTPTPGHTVPFADLRSGRGHTVPLAPTPDAQRLFAPTAGTQCLSRTSGQDAGTQCLSRPTAGTQCLSRLRRSLRKQTARRLLSAPYGKPYRSKARIFIKATIAAPPHVGNRSHQIQKDPIPGVPGLGPCCLLGKSLPFYFIVSDLPIRRTTFVYESTYAIVTEQCLTAFWPGRVV